MNSQPWYIFLVIEHCIFTQECQVFKKYDLVPSCAPGTPGGGTQRHRPCAAPFYRERNQDPEPKRFAWGGQRVPGQQESTTWGSWFPATSLAVGRGTSLNRIFRRQIDCKAAKKGCCCGVSGGDEWEQGLWLQTDEGKGIHPETARQKRESSTEARPGGEETLNCIYWCLVLNTKLYFLPFQISALKPWSEDSSRALHSRSKSLGGSKWRFHVTVYFGKICKSKIVSFCNESPRLYKL